MFPKQQYKTEKSPSVCITSTNFPYILLYGSISLYYLTLSTLIQSFVPKLQLKTRCGSIEKNNFKFGKPVDLLSLISQKKIKNILVASLHCLAKNCKYKVPTFTPGVWTVFLHFPKFLHCTGKKNYLKVAIKSPHCPRNALGPLPFGEADYRYIILLIDKRRLKN